MDIRCIFTLIKIQGVIIVSIFHIAFRSFRFGSEDS
jgi:hypothetical protein